MLQHAAASFFVMIAASFAGFGGLVETAAAGVKGLAVIALVAFFVSLFRLLYEAEAQTSTDL
jgi:uncharacterized membrane protein YtjA (UPF0391 family)